MEKRENTLLLCVYEQKAVCFLVILSVFHFSVQQLLLNSSPGEISALCVSTDRRYVESLRLFTFHCADVLVIFRHRKHLVRSCFGLFCRHKHGWKIYLCPVENVQFLAEKHPDNCGEVCVFQQQNSLLLIKNTAFCCHEHDSKTFPTSC